MFPVRYGLSFYINLLRNSVFKGLMYVHTILNTKMMTVRNSYIAFDVVSMKVYSPHSEIIKTVLMRD
jgi:hypothetical protein